MNDEVTFKEFAEIMAKRNHSLDDLVQRFRGTIDDPREFFERVLSCKWHGQDRSDVVIPYHSVIEFYREELHYFTDTAKRQRFCQCGCRKPVFGQYKFASDACRKRVQRSKQTETVTD